MIPEEDFFEMLLASCDSRPPEALVANVRTVLRCSAEATQSLRVAREAAVAVGDFARDTGHTEAFCEIARFVENMTLGLAQIEHGPRRRASNGCREG